MRIFLIALALFLVGSTASFAKSIDSLLIELESDEKQDTTTFLIYYNLSLEWMDTSLDSAEVWALRARDFAKMIDYDRGQAYAYSQLGVASNIRENYLEAAYQFEQCLKHSESVMSPLKRSFMVGNISLMHEQVGDFEKALDYSLQCLKMRENLKDTVHLAYACYNVGSLHQKLDNRDDAFYYHKRALELRKKIEQNSNEYNVIEDSYCAIAQLQQEGESWDEALANFRLALSLRGKTSDERSRTWSEAAIYQSIGEIKMEQNQVDSAFSYFSKALILNKSAKEGRSSKIASTLLMIGKANISLNRPELAIENLLEAKNLVDTIDVLPMRTKIALQLSNAYEMTGELKQAILYKNAHLAMNDSLINREKVNSIREMQTRFETEKKDREISQLNAEKELALAISKQQKTVMISLAVGIFLALLLSLVIFRAYRQKGQLNEALEKRNSEKEALLKEIHHRVKNNLQVISSLLNLQSANLVDSAALEAIKEGQNRVKSIALIHQKLYQTEDLSKVDFQEYCEQLISFLQATFKIEGKNIEVDVEMNGIHLDIDTAVPLGLIINELITNAYKYAFVNQDLGAIKISITNGEDGYALHVSDNGCGMPDGFDLKKSKSLGMKLVNILSRQLKGSVQWENRAGTHYTINFKETSARKMTA